MAHGISVVMMVYNEEQRIQRAVRAFYEYDEVIIIDKSSTDSTVKIARESGAKVIVVPYTDNTSIQQVGVEAASFDWVLMATASDVVHPDFTRRLYKLIENEKFNEKYNRIEYPCTMHVLGIESKCSVYDWPYRSMLAKKDDLNMNDLVHIEMEVKNERKYRMKPDRERALHHLSHENVDIMFERGHRYTKMEMIKDISYKSCFKSMVGVLIIAVKKRFWKLGWHGLVLMMTLINYQIILMMRLMERDMGDVKEMYNEYADKMINHNNKHFRNKEYERLYYGK